MILESITWAQYLSGTAVIAGVYYGYVFYKHYRKPLLERLTRMEEEGKFLPLHDHGSEGESDQSIEKLETLVNSIKKSIFEKAGKGADRQELKDLILVFTASYDGLGKPAYRSALCNFVIRYGKEICDVDFSEEELEELWDGLH